MSESVTITMQPTKGFAELARSLRVAAALAGKDATITWPMSPEEARTFAKAIERLEVFPQEVADFHSRADQKIAQMRAENRKNLYSDVAYFVLAAVLIASMRMA